MQIDLIVTGGEPLAWEWGRALDGRGGVSKCEAAIRAWMEGERAGWVLFWDATLGTPERALIQELIRRPVDVWHAGLWLGLGGLPELFDFVIPCWMLHGDPDPTIEASSWRVTLRCCLIRGELLGWLQGLDAGYASLEAAGLDLGYRAMAAGALMRHHKELAGGAPAADVVRLGIEDEARLTAKTRGRKWLLYGLARAVMAGARGLAESARTYRRARKAALVQPGGWQRRGGGMSREAGRAARAARVTVLVPTVDRYPYLRVLMRQLASQTVKPHEVIVVDQTAPERRQCDWVEAAAGLPLQVLELDEAGQCTSRNAGLRASTGEWVLFLDDDDEVAPDLIERFLASAEEHGADVVCGVADEVSGARVPPWFEIRRMSDVFPTNAGMVRREAFQRSGLFDLAYNRGARADGDLGMRLYRSGAQMVLDPAIRVLHHHAPSGGLRKHKARVVTYARSRTSVWARHLPEATELYLRMRYFTPRQVRESLIQSVLGTFAVRGPWWKRAAKIGAGLVLLPDTIWHIRRRANTARRMLAQYPAIEQLGMQATGCPAAEF
jgi:glycosyltransferase involved in cell wall biosynthesis